MSTPNDIIAVATPEGNPTYVVDLPVNLPLEKLGITMSPSPRKTNDPPSIKHVDISSPLHGKIQIGHYVQAVKLVNLQILNIVDLNHLTDILRVNTGYPRQLVISSTKYYIDPMVGRRAAHPFFMHQLPASPQIGFAMNGFPPVITSVTEMMEGRLFPGQTVEGLYIPGRPVMNLQAGGFTSDNVHTALYESSAIEGRQLIVRDGSTRPKKTGSNAPFDDCVIS